MKSDFETYGTKWIWIIANSGSGPPTVEQGATYYAGEGVTFGWVTNDADNTWRPYEFHNTPMGGGVPWIGIIDAKTMMVAYNNPSDVRSAVQALASD